MDWVTRRIHDMWAEGVEVLCTSKSVSWCLFHQGRSGAALGCKTDENVNFLRIYGILGGPGGRGLEGGGRVGGHAYLRIKLAPARSRAGGGRRSSPGLIYVLVTRQTYSYTIAIL
jgi:hypothetical protein